MGAIPPGGGHLLHAVAFRCIWTHADPGGALDAVSARLTTSDLIYLNRQVTVAGHNVLAEARTWLERPGILPEPG
jgi:glycine betaine/choline ABC-type transport system substrate-binding protein